jgi:hypothetical protein
MQKVDSLIGQDGKEKPKVSTYDVDLDSTSCDFRGYMIGREKGQALCLLSSLFSPYELYQ